MKNTKLRYNQLIRTALLIALSVVLPFAFHSVPNGGSIFCPMHIPVILCGLICNWQYALICGVLSPVISSMITGMPNPAMLPKMIVELAIYGVLTALMLKVIRTKKTQLDIYISIIISMVVGRVCAGAVTALFFTKGGTAISDIAVAYFVTCIPGIIIQLIFIPAVYFALYKAKLIPARYGTNTTIKEKNLVDGE